MKVLESGNPNGVWTTEIKCSGFGNGGAGCGALLEVVAADLFHTRTSFMGRNETDLLTIECPECKTWTDFTESKAYLVPQGIRSRTFSYKNSTTDGGITREPKNDTIRN